MRWGMELIQSATKEKVGFEAAGSDCTFLYFQNISASVLLLGGSPSHPFTHLPIYRPTLQSIHLPTCLFIHLTNV